jgi:hypothetical protein
MDPRVKPEDDVVGMVKATRETWPNENGKAKIIARKNLEVHDARESET